MPLPDPIQPTARGEALSIKYLCLQATREGQASYAHVHEIVNGLITSGCSVEIIEPEYDGNHSPGLAQRVWQFLRANARAIARMRQDDLIYVRFHIASWPACLWASARGIKVVQEVNGAYGDAFTMYPWLNRMRWIAEWMMRRPLMISDGIIAVTPQLELWAKSEVGEKLTRVIPNGANIKIFNPGALSRVAGPTPYVIFFGALSPWQGVDDLVEAVNDPAWPADVTLVIAGDGAQAGIVAAAAQKNSHLLYLGRLNYRDIAGLVAGSVASLIPKTNHGNHQSTGLSPLKLYESMACGVPCIVTELPGLADLVRENDCGLVVPPSNPSAIAAAVATLFADESMRTEMGKRARTAAVEQHSWEARANSTLDFLVAVSRTTSPSE